MSDIQPNQMIALAERMRRAVLQRDAAALARLVTVYKSTYKDIETAVTLLTSKVAGEAMTKGQIQRMGQYKDMLDTIERELSQFGSYLSTTLKADARDLLAQGSRDARIMIGEAVGGNQAVLARIKMVNPDVLETLLGFLDPNGSLMKYWTTEKIYKATADEIAKKIASGIAQGWNPVKLARELKKDAGFVLDSALRTARTVQLWSYREASRANYQANSDIVIGYQWLANLDDKVCEVCAALDGKIFPTDEPTSNHWQCRCTLAPVTILNPNGHISQTAGEDWFNSLPEDKQREILGAGKLEALKEGKFKFSDLGTQKKEDKVFGEMYSTRSLESLLAGK